MTIEDGHLLAAHVDLTRDIDGAPLAVEGELAPGLRDLTPLGHDGIGVDWCPCTGSAVGERDGLDSASWDGDGDERLDGIHPGACNTPDDKDDLLTGGVDKVVDVWSIITEPDTTVVRRGISANLGQTDLREEGVACC